jgi:hypothetical protein
MVPDIRGNEYVKGGGFNDGAGEPFAPGKSRSRHRTARRARPRTEQSDDRADPKPRTAAAGRYA